MTRSTVSALFTLLQSVGVSAQTTTSCHFDCQEGINNWKAAWAEPKKKYCCEHEQIACEGPVTTTSCHFDCSVGLANWKAAWAPQKQEWCCQNEHVACPDTGVTVPAIATIPPLATLAPLTLPPVVTLPPVAPVAPLATTTTSCHYDCQMGLNNWKAGWAPQKIEYCCKHEGVACGDTTTTSCHYDCQMGLNNWRAGWAPQKIEYCCKHEGVACAETTTTNYDCQAGFDSWKTGWTPTKIDYCCSHEGVACPETTTTIDCSVGLDNYKATWTPEKMDFCCKKDGVACPETTTTLDCSTGLDNYKTAWTPERIDQCCKTLGVACPATTTTVDCSTGLDNYKAAWTPERIDHCCKTVGVACPDTTTTVDCSTDLANFQTAWTPERIDYCCKTMNVACPETTTTVDCSTDLANFKTAWTPERMAHCCTTVGVACPETTTTLDCSTGLDTYKTTWTPERIQQCCATVGVACPETTTTVDCSTGLDTYKTTWTPERMETCCTTVGVACPETTTTLDCSTGLDTYKTTWTPERIEQCCKTLGVACPETTTTVDCSTDLENFQTAWTPERIDFCCTTLSVACPETTTTVDCSTGLDNFQASWTPERIDYCCKNQGVACETTTVPTVAAQDVPATTLAPLPNFIMTCKLACHFPGGQPITLPGSVGVGAGASLNDVSLDACRRACATVEECDAVMYTDHTQGVPFKTMCYGKKNLHTDKCQPGGNFITEVVGANKRVMGKCAVFGDPHVVSFDRILGPPTTITEPGIYYLIKNDQLSLHARFGYTRRFPTASSAVGIAVSGPLIKGHKLVVAYIGPERGYKGFKVLWNGQPILGGYPSSFSDGVLDAKHDAMDPQEYHREGRHTIGGTEGLLPSYFFDLGKDLNIYILIGPDNCNVVIEAAKLPGTQDGWCGNFNCDQDDDSIAGLRARGVFGPVPAAESLFNGSPEPPAWVMKKVEPPSLKECPATVKTAAEEQCAHLPNGEKESCIFDACAADKARAAADADVGIEALPFDCDAGLPTQWQSKQQEWCCQKRAICTDADAAARHGNACDNECEYNGKAVRCKERITWASTHQFLYQDAACPKAVELVRQECKGLCDGCTMELSNCMNVQFFERFEQHTPLASGSALLLPLLGLGLSCLAAAVGFFALRRRSVQYGPLSYQSSSENTFIMEETLE